MQRGLSWLEAAVHANLQISQATPYRLLSRFRTEGKAELQDGRHGHASKLRDPIRQWLEAYCRASPSSTSRTVQTAPNTVVRAYSELEHEGWVTTAARRGVIIASPSPTQIAKVRAQQFEQAVIQLLVTAHQLGVTPAQIHAEIDRLLNAFPPLDSRR